MASLETLKSLYRFPETPGSYFVSLEGIEGSGKSTQIALMQRWLEGEGFRVLTLREPGGTAFGEKLREAILKSETPLHPLAECHLFLASRAQLLKEKVLPFLLQPRSVVILDRYFDSTLAYQGFARRLGPETILTLHQHDPLNLLPHLTLLLEIRLATSQQRQQSRGQVKDYFEAEAVEFYQRLIDGYESARQLFPERIRRIDAEKSESEVQEEILRELRKVLG
jgi:dTMP kinase